MAEEAEEAEVHSGLECKASRRASPEGNETEECVLESESLGTILYTTEAPRYLKHERHAPVCLLDEHFASVENGLVSGRMRAG